MHGEPYQQVVEGHWRPGRRPVLSAFMLLLFVIVLGLIYGSTIPSGLRPWMINLLYPPFQ
jgi:hypothetical protein